MATINDIKNSAWASKFLASQGVSLEELDSLKDTSALTLAFEEFMLEKYQDPEISTPEQETRAESPEIQQRLEEIVNSNLENKPSGYPLKELNQDFEDIAYQTAIRSLALSEDEITQENLEKFCQGIQHNSPIDNYATPIPCEFPGYPHDEIMAAGTFTNGSTIELTCDGPVIPPYTAFMQGSLTFDYGKLIVMSALTKLLKK